MEGEREREDMLRVFMATSEAWEMFQPCSNAGGKTHRCRFLLQAEGCCPDFEKYYMRGLVSRNMTS